MTEEHAPSLPADPLLERLDALRAAGAAATDPVKLQYLGTLARRMQDAPPAVAAVLRTRLEQALEGVAAPEPEPEPLIAEADADAPADEGSAAATEAPEPPLAALNRYIREVLRESAGGRAARDELPGVQKFRESWSRIRAEEDVAQAISRAPENAGPLNSHRLVLQTLTLMRELSPAYLRRFLSHADTLLWLEQARGTLRGVVPTPASPPPRRSRPRRK